MKATAAIIRNVGGPFLIEDVEVQSPIGAEVLVRVVGVGMCHTDLVARDGFPVPMPIVLGHEGSGIVEAVGPDVKGLTVGDHVVLSFVQLCSVRDVRRTSASLLSQFSCL